MFNVILYHLGQYGVFNDNIYKVSAVQERLLKTVFLAVGLIKSMLSCLIPLMLYNSLKH